MQLTKAVIATLSPPANKTEAIFFDDDVQGLGLRYRRSGPARWIFQYRIGTRQRRMSLGAVGNLDPKEARRLARQLHARVALGHDPQDDKRRAQAASVNTVEALVQDYLSDCEGALRPRSYAETKRYLTRDWKPLHAHSVHSIKRGDVADRLRAIARSVGKVAADRARAALSAMFAWAIREGRAEVNPVQGTRVQAGKVERDRVLTDAELVEIWQACGDSSYGKIVRILMLVPARREEIGGMQWSEIDTAGQRWLLPAARSKNHRPVSTPLPDGAWSIVEQQRGAGGGKVIFSQSLSGFSGWSGCKARLDKTISRNRRARGQMEDMPNWRLHDLRRTIATRLSEMGTAPHIVAELLGHVGFHKTGVSGVYNRAQYDNEKLVALKMWELRLMRLL
jgi:integrase